MSFDDWLAHFQSNPARQLAIEARIDWDAASPMNERTRRAFVRSFQRFELGESGDGERLLGKALAAGDPTYLAALELLVEEEQKHSALFGRGLDHLGAHRLSAHWSDAAFTRLRRALGLRTELALFLIAETVAMGYFVALAEHAPDPVLRGIGRRVATDERDHIRFQIDRLRVGFLRTPRAARAVIGLSWGVIAVGAAAVIAVDHRAALRACGLSAMGYWWRSLRQFRRAAASVLVKPSARPLAPTTKNS